MVKSRGGNGIVEITPPVLFIIRMVVECPNPDAAPPPLDEVDVDDNNGTVTDAIGPPLGQPAMKVVVVVDSKCDISVLLL